MVWGGPGRWQRGGTSSLIQSVTLGKTVDARQTSRQGDAESHQLRHFASRVLRVTGTGEGQTSGPARNLTPIPPRGTAVIAMGVKPHRACQVRTTFGGDSAP